MPGQGTTPTGDEKAGDEGTDGHGRSEDEGGEPMSVRARTERAAPDTGWAWAPWPFVMTSWDDRAGQVHGQGVTR